ncbi:phospholipase A [Orrella sp. JC864]|uniref:phospholipase A n=1 Tax=Orrella sp. JC864 TaxID=3120298 RepID=UPI0012BB71AA
MQRPYFRNPFPRALLGMLAGLLAGTAQATVSYKLDRAQAGPGETIEIHAVFVNDTPNQANWSVPAQLVLQWRGPDGGIQRTLARRQAEPATYSVPVNNFAKASWRAVVPQGVRGLQSVTVEGEPVMMALDTGGAAPVASTPANVPVTEAGGPAAALAAADPGQAPPPAGPAPTEAALAAHAAPARSTDAFEAFRNNVSAYEPVYFIVGSRNETHARFQLSFKYRLFTPQDETQPRFIDQLYLGYTQTALWDLAGQSKPFIDTTYNPSLFWRSERLWQTQDQRVFLGMTAGVEHASNGKDGEDSRSLNDVFVEPAVNYRFAGGSTLSFAPRVKAYFARAGENRDYADYAGNVDWKLRWAQDNGLVLSALYRQGEHGRRTTQLDAAWPLQRTFLRMNGYLYAQYFNGYGETLLGYDRRNDSQFRLGLALVP